MKVGKLVKSYVPIVFRHCEDKNTSELSRLMTSEYSNNVL